MKRFIILAFLMLLSFGAAGQRNFGRTLFTIPSLMFIPPAGCGMIVFYDCETELFGFLLNSSDLQIMIEAEFEDVYNDVARECDYMFPVKKNGKWGYVDTNLSRSLLLEQPVIPCIYDRVEPFRNGKGRVTKGGETFYVNVAGEKIDK